MQVLVTGASGYVGGRLLRSLEEGGHAVRCLARRPREVAAARPSTHVVQGDCLDAPSLEGAFDGIDTAYYLVHSMGAGRRFAELDHRAAVNFGREAARASVRRIVYLGGLADDVTSLSAHLRSRADTGEALRASGVPVVEFRASIVIGAGSLSFEIVRALVERLPVMVCPRWVETQAQPIAIDDVVAYLRAALDLPQTGGRVFEIGGPDVVSYGEIMRRYARLRGLRRLLVPVPVLSPRLSGMWLALVTPAQARVGRALVEGLRNPSIVRSSAVRETFAVEPMPLDVALTKAIDEAAGAHWKVDTRTVIVNAPPAQAFAPIRRIGGRAGWYYGHLLWKTRGRIDRWMGGVGMNGERRDPDHCTLGDVIDGWTVDRYDPDGRLRLLAGMKLPGRGWLDFEVAPVDGGRRSRIRQTARFDPKGVLGRAYWYAVLPFHSLIFRGLLRCIAQLAEQGDEAGPAAPESRGTVLASLRSHMSRRTHWLVATVVAVWCSLPAGVSAKTQEPVRTVERVDLVRYAGDWFEVARLPNRFQRRCVGDVRARYTIRPDGRIEVLNRCRTGEGETGATGVARVVDLQTSAKLKVRFAPAALSFLPFVWGDYWVLGLADDYTWAVVGSPDRKYLWILSRTRQLPPAVFSAAVDLAQSNGFDTDQLIVTNAPGPD